MKAYKLLKQPPNFASWQGVIRSSSIKDVKMKNIAVIALLLIGLIFYFSNKDPFPTTVYFSGEEYKLGQDTGKKGMAKTYQYTKSGNINGLNDYVHIFVVDKLNEANDFVDPIRSSLDKSYNLKTLDSSNGKFGVFRVPSEQREYYAYSIERETSSSQLFLTFVIQSNFGNKTIDSSEAKQKTDEYLSSLESVYNDVSH